jgi:hypothetical protein
MGLKNSQNGSLQVVGCAVGTIVGNPARDAKSRLRLLFDSILKAPHTAQREMGRV